MSKILIGRGDTDLDYPICRPSLDLDFTQEVLDPRITFTRGSIGTRVNRNRLIETVSANQPRFDYDPVTGECKGLLIEESRSNLLTYSDDTSSYHSINSATVTTNQIIAPDGTLTGDVLTSTITGGNNNCHIQKVQTVSANTSTYVMSVFLKAGNTTQSIINLQLAGGTYQQSRATINWTTNTISSGDGTATLTAYPNGWYRASLTLTNNGTNTGVYPRVCVKTQGTNNITGEYVYIWGWQVEVGAFPTSYIPTTASTVTRSADLASITGTNFSSFFNQNEGTFYTSTYKQTAPSSAGMRVLEISDGTNNNRTEIGYFSTGAYIYSSYSGPVQYQTYPSTTFPTSTKQAFSYSQLVNNLTYITSLSSSVSRYNKFLKPTYTSLGIGRATAAGTNQFGGTISRLTYYPRRLKDFQLSLLTQ